MTPALRATKNPVLQAQGKTILPFAISMGDPSGIGPDVCLMAWVLRKTHFIPPFFIVGDPALLIERAICLDLPAHSILSIENPIQSVDCFASQVPVLPVRLKNSAPLPKATPGMPNTAFAPLIRDSIAQAVHLVMSGQAAALVTAPIAKHVLLSDDFTHAGHTEFLGELAIKNGAHSCKPVMLMASPKLNVVPVTVHIPLKEVIKTLSEELLIETAQITVQGMQRYFAIPCPRLAVSGVNPHAGELGQLGREEIEIIAPAIQKLKAQGLYIFGPLSADTLFHDKARKTYDAALAMYHDQALIPFKTLAFENGVNVTLGLPFIRTSPDHGTAFSLAGTRKANPASFIAALQLAHRMADNANTYAINGG